MRAEDFLKEKQSAEEFLSASKPRPGEIDTRTSKPVPPAFEEESILKPIGEDIQENWTRYAGATVGSVAGVPGGPAGMILGATLGGAAGESYKQLGQHLGEPEAAPKTSLEAAKKIGMAGTKSAAEEVVGIAGGKVIGKVLAPFSKTITDDARIAYDVLDKYMPKATGLKPVSRSLGKKVPAILPAEMTEHRGLDILHNIAEKSIIGGRSIADYKNIVRRGAVEDMVDDLADSFGKQVDADVLGETITDLISTKFKAFKDSVTT
ncbi:MAG: hypothetical protein PF495_12685, partial [Spirochaetales bacterium]|nr:hypothetical protein [Spirochaetales bacterium]